MHFYFDCDRREAKRFKKVQKEQKNFLQKSVIIKQKLSCLKSVQPLSLSLSLTLFLLKSTLA